MTRRPFSDREIPEPDEDDADELDSLECPNCGRGIYSEAEQCPFCGEWMNPESTSVLSGRPLWFVALAILGMIAFIVVTLAH